MVWIPIRKQMRLATLSAEVAGKLRAVWKNTRKIPLLIHRNYNLAVEIAKAKGIKIPRPKINMEVE